MNTFHNHSAATGRTRSNDRGFTLIEMLVVMAMLAALPALLLPEIQKVREAYAHNEASANVNQLITASQEYRNRTGSYPHGVDDLVGWDFTGLDPKVAQGKKNGYLYEIIESDQDHCRIEAKPEFPGITGSLTMGAVVTSNYVNPRIYQILSAGANEAKDRMLNNIRAKAAETLVKLLNLDNSATSQVPGYVESPDAINGVFNTLDGNNDGRVSVEEILTSSSAIPDAELRSPLEEFLAYVAEEMKLDSLSEEAKRSIAVGIADLEQCQGCNVRLTFSEAVDSVAATLEIIGDGLSNTFLVGEKPPSPGGSGDDVITGGLGDVMVGIVPDKTLWFSAFNSEGNREPISLQVRVYDEHGIVIAMSPEVVIPAGESRSVGFDYDDLHMASEPGTGRKQVRIGPFFEFRSNRLSRVPAALALVDKSGATAAGHQCLVFFLGGIPND